MFFIQNEFVVTKVVQPSLIPQADTYFIDGSSNGIGGINGPDIHQSINTSFSSAQTVELAVLINLLWLIHKPLNIVSASTDVVGLFLAINSYLYTLTFLALLQKEISKLVH